MDDGVRLEPPGVFPRIVTWETFQPRASLSSCPYTSTFPIIGIHITIKIWMYLRLDFIGSTFNCQDHFMSSSYLKCVCFVTILKLVVLFKPILVRVIKISPVKLVKFLPRNSTSSSLSAE